MNSVVLPLSVAVTAPDSVLPMLVCAVATKESVHDPLVVIGDEPVTVIWPAVPASPTLVTVPDPVAHDAMLSTPDPLL